MKKVYSKPALELIDLEFQNLMEGSRPGKGFVTVGDQEPTELQRPITGTGGDTDFDQGAKGGTWNGWDD